MLGHTALETHPMVAVFDLDGTLTWSDTLAPYLTGYALRHPERWLRFWQIPVALLAYAGRHRDRGILKSALIRTVMGGASRPEVDAWSARFVAGLRRRGAFRPAALATVETHRTAGDRLVLLSASPDLYVPLIGRMLGFELTVCTELRWVRDSEGTMRLDGGLITPNRRGDEKSRCLADLRRRFADLNVVAYGNSDSDLPHLRQADRALLVNGNAKARRGAAEAGITVADWT